MSVRKEVGMLTELVSQSLGVTMTEADEIIDKQARIGLDMIANDRLTIEDVDELMYDMGVEPDYLYEFLLRMC